MLYNYVNGPTADIAYALKAICETNPDLSLKELRIMDIPLTGIKFLSDDERPEKIRFRKQIPYYMNLPAQMVARGQDPLLTVFKIRNSDILSETGMNRAETGLCELELANIGRASDNPLIFWCYRSARGASGLKTPLGRDFFIFRQRDLKQFYRTIIKARPPIESVRKPILPPSYIDDIYKNTIGFLLSGQNNKKLYKEYKIPFKRGILLAGKPGSGKTLTCKWLRHLCQDKELDYKVVTMNEYEEAYRQGTIRHLFRLETRGIIFFDDMDILVKDRSNGQHELFSFLSFFDGMDSNEGVVYVFTSNLIADLDQAFVRPGRIDLFLTFRDPGFQLRKQFIESMFPKKLKKGIDIEDIVERTKDYTFAEIEEVRKLFCFDMIARQKINVDLTFKTFKRHRHVFQQITLQGFGNLADSENDDPWDELEGVLPACPDLS